MRRVEGRGRIFVLSLLFEDWFSISFYTDSWGNYRECFLLLVMRKISKINISLDGRVDIGRRSTSGDVQRTPCDEKFRTHFNDFFP